MEDNKVILKRERYSDDSQFWCPECHILMQYKYAGKFVCEKCGCEQYNDFGKIKKYLDENGPTNAVELSANTGVRKSKIGEYLRLGRVEIPENSSVFIHCKSCGVPIRFGNYCANCVHSKNIQGAFIGEVAKSANSKMRFLDSE